jgi:Skp family chaperone for outer membrane proteins
MLQQAGGDRRHQDDLRELIRAVDARVDQVEKKAAADMAAMRRDLLEEIQEHRTQHREAHSRLRDSFNQIDERMNSFSRGLSDQRDDFTRFASTPVQASNLHLTTTQTIAIVVFCVTFVIGWWSSWTNISNRLDTQFQLQAERNTTLTAAMSDVKKAQAMSDAKRVEDYDRISRAFADAQRGVKQP